MKTIQMTIDEPLLAEVDRWIAELATTRSAFIRDALKAAVRKKTIAALEEQHAQAYARQPMTSDEVEIWLPEQVWEDA